MKIGTAAIVIVLAAILQATQPIYADLNSGLVAYYPFNGNANDASGNGNNGTVVGATFATDTPNNRTGLLCNGTSATYVVVPRSTSLEPTDAISISLWCKGVPGAANTYGTILRKAGNLQPGYFLRKFLHDDVDVTPSFRLDYSATSDCAFSSSDGTSWRHLVATYSRTDGFMRTYVNGVEISSTPLSQTLQHSGDLFIGGATVHPQDGGFNGLINEVRIYNRALSAAEVQQLFGQARRPVIVIPGGGGSEITCPDPYTLECFQHGFPFNDILADRCLGVPTSANPVNLQFTQTGQPRTDTISSQLIAPRFVSVGYAIEDLIGFLQSNGYVKDATLFEFPYDWRFSVATIASRLSQFIEAVKASTGSDKVDMVTHSMGGLVAKQYLSIPSNAGNVGTLIMIAPPNLGAPKALKYLRYGDDLGFPANICVDACHVKRAVHNAPGLFDLLPSQRYFNVLGGYYEDAADIDGDGTTGLLDFSHTVYNLKNGQEDSLNHCPLQSNDAAPLRKLSSTLVDAETVTFHNAIDGWNKPEGVNVFVIVGHGVQTIVKIKESSFWGFRQVSLTPSCFGDGTVPLRSADSVAADEVYYVYGGSHGSAKHNELLSNGDVQTQVLGLLSNGRGIYGDPNFIGSTRPTFCPNVSIITSYSPVRIGLFDSQGRHTGLLQDGSTETAIPGSAVEIFGESQSVIVPEGDSYLVLAEATGTGTFGLEQTDADGDGNELRSIKWEGVPIAVGSQDTLVTAFGAQNPVLNIDTNGDGVVDYSLAPDADGDRVPDYLDQCPNTPLGAIVNANGCSIAQLAPCAGPRSGGKWKTHGAYVSAVANAANQFLAAGLITQAQKDAIVGKAATSNCGTK